MGSGLRVEQAQVRTNQRYLTKAEAAGRVHHLAEPGRRRPLFGTRHATCETGGLIDESSLPGAACDRQRRLCGRGCGCREASVRE